MKIEKTPPSILYHPVMYTGISKTTAAYLHIGLLDENQLGIGQQLLIAHVLKFVQKSGLKKLFNFKDFHPKYQEEILLKFKEKGIDLESQIPWVINEEKITSISSENHVHRPSESEFDHSNVYMSSNYSQFNLLDFNRKIINSHVNDLIISIQEHGILSYGVVVHTDCVDGILKYWIADGQHRFTAEKKLALPFYFTMTKVKSKEELVRLIARLNSTGRRWNLLQYLTTWNSVNSADYSLLKKKYEETHLQLSVLIQIFMDKDRRRATEKFMKGYFEIKDLTMATKMIDSLVDLRKENLVPKSRAISSCLIHLMKSQYYEHQSFKKALKGLPQTYIFSHKEDELMGQLKGLLKAA